MKHRVKITIFLLVAITLTPILNSQHSSNGPYLTILSAREGLKLDEWGIEDYEHTVELDSQIMGYGINRLNIEAAWKQGYTGKGVKIAIIDTGIAPHEDLLISGGKSFVSYTTDYGDDNGHGTHVAGIIAAQNNEMGTVGVAPNAEIYAVKVLDKNGGGYISDIVHGIEWAIENEMDIINLSLGTSLRYSVLKDAVDMAESNGILVVAAAGNDGTEAGVEDTIDNPASYSSTIAVVALNKENHRASFSSTGTQAEIAAPGVEIISTFLDNQYAKMNGTSMAAPHISGVLALMMEAYPSASPAELRKILQQNGIDLGTNRKDIQYGYGLAQAPYEYGYLYYRFSDVKNHWGSKFIKDLTEKNIMNGYGDGSFGPNNYLTREEFAKLMVLAMGIPVTTESRSDISVDFFDQDRMSLWAVPYIQKAVESGLILGFGDQNGVLSFKPHANISRQEAAVILARAANIENDYNNDLILTFTDKDKIADWAEIGIKVTIAQKYMIGNHDNTFRPLTPITRAEAAAIISRFHNDSTK